MLIAEYDYATDIAVQRAEAGRIAFANGIEQGKSLGLAEGKSLGLAEGKSLGLAEGKSLGLAEGSRQAKLETARLMLQRNYSTAEICLMTGLTKVEVETMCN